MLTPLSEALCEENTGTRTLYSASAPSLCCTARIGDEDKRKIVLVK